MKQLLLSIFVVLGSVYSTFAQDLNSFFKDADAFFAKHVSNNKIQYATIKSNPADLTKLTDFIGSADVSGYTDAQLKAFYINNANQGQNKK